MVSESRWTSKSVEKTCKSSQQKGCKSICKHCHLPLNKQIPLWIRSLRINRKNRTKSKSADPRIKHQTPTPKPCNFPVILGLFTWIHTYNLWDEPGKFVWAFPFSWYCQSLANLFVYFGYLSCGHTSWRSMAIPGHGIYTKSLGATTGLEHREVRVLVL